MPTKPKTFRQRFMRRRRTNPRERTLAQKLRSTARWQTVRELKLQRDPLCEDPFGVHDGPEAAVEVHHIRKIEDAPELVFEDNNLASLCERCHDRLSAMERRWEDAVGVFKQ